MTGRAGEGGDASFGARSVLEGRSEPPQPASGRAANPNSHESRMLLDLSIEFRVSEFRSVSRSLFPFSPFRFLE